MSCSLCFRVEGQARYAVSVYIYFTSDAKSTNICYVFELHIIKKAFIFSHVCDMCYEVKNKYIISFHTRKYTNMLYSFLELVSSIYFRIKYLLYVRTSIVCISPRYTASSITRRATSLCKHSINSSTRFPVSIYIKCFIFFLKKIGAINKIGA